MSDQDHAAVLRRHMGWIPTDGEPAGEVRAAIERAIELLGRGEDEAEQRFMERGMS